MRAKKEIKYADNAHNYTRGRMHCARAGQTSTRYIKCSSATQYLFSHQPTTMQFKSVIVALTAASAVSAANHSNGSNGSNHSNNSSSSSHAGASQLVGAGVFGAVAAAGVALLI